MRGRGVGRTSMRRMVVMMDGGRDWGEHMRKRNGQGDGGEETTAWTWCEWLLRTNMHNMMSGVCACGVAN